MDLKGSIPIRVPPATVARVLQNPVTLAAVLPACRAIREIAPGRFVAQIEYAAGPIPIKFDADVTVTEVAADQAYLMQVTGGTRLTGVVTVTTDVTLRETPRGCILAYSGTLVATGIAKRLLAGQQAAVRSRMERVFARMKQDIEQSWNPQV